jgi:putative ABC transport system substrate-binding protein
MKNNNIFFVFIGIIFLLVFMVVFKAKNPLASTSSEHLQQEGGKKIAIMLQLSHPALEEIVQGFLETLQGKISFQYDLYNGNGDRVLMRQQAEEVVMKNYDLIFTVPTTPSLIMKEVCQQRGKNIPVVAGAVDDPVGIKLVETMKSSGNNITAVTSIDTFEQQIETLQFLKPTTNSILLVYNPTPGLDQRKKEIERICKARNIMFTAIEIFNIADLMQKVSNFVDSCDTVLVLKDNLVVSGIESLVNLCSKHKKTLYASDLNSGDKGAALSYGVYEYQDGVESALKAIEILKEGKQPTDIPSTATMGFKIKVNTKTMHTQGLDLSPELLFVMKSGEVV